MSDDETAPEMLERLGTDAMLWAQEFSKTAVKLGYSAMDEGWLIGWFANAIENCDVVRCNPIRSDLALIATRDGRPMTKESFGNWFRDACKAAGVPGSAHGLRKAGATRCAEAGATIHELNAIFGWSGTKMAGHYTEKADRARLARQAMGKMDRNKS